MWHNRPELHPSRLTRYLPSLSGMSNVDSGLRTRVRLDGGVPGDGQPFVAVGLSSVREVFLGDVVVQQGLFGSEMCSLRPAEIRGRRRVCGSGRQRNVRRRSSVRCGIVLNESSDNRSGEKTNSLTEQLRTRQFTSRNARSRTFSAVCTRIPIGPPEINRIRRCRPAPRVSSLANREEVPGF
jgi:hypothetical protein